MPLSNKRSQGFLEEMTDSGATAENMEMSLDYLVTPEGKKMITHTHTHTQ